ncbi:MAG: 1-deoxy-D-xylulose-5-phosphate reductoisomerase [Pirellulaceae bacterium]|jgi:1-deoxy-D-xylulose-5-phosphate reductoisomerase
MASNNRRQVAVFGSTGSIGRATLDVLSGLKDRLQLHAISAHLQLDLLSEQQRQHAPCLAIATDPATATRLGWMEGPQRELRRVGEDAMMEVARHPDVDIVVAGIVGMAGLMSCLVAAESGKRLALANKEALVVAGPLLTRLVEERGGELLPIDSEHSAIFQALHAGRGKEQVRRLILTASGGSLRDWPIDRLADATAEDALRHPNWQMGKKITVDSATMMNKALEVIEARWLFGIAPENIAVVIHPQSIIHSMVEFVDGSVVAQLSPPDMRLPIQLALTYPDRFACPAAAFDWSTSLSLDWRPLDPQRYPALELGYEVARRGGTTGVVLNAANEVAVEQFLAGRITFPRIVEACRKALDHHHYDPNPSLEELIRLDRWARQEVLDWTQRQCSSDR